MTDKAIDLLENRKGFFLQVEGPRSTSAITPRTSRPTELNLTFIGFY